MRRVFAILLLCLGCLMTDKAIASLNNRGFEDGLSSWTTLIGATASSADAKLFGNYGLKLTTNAPGGSRPLVYQITTSTFEAGQYELVFYVKIATPGTDVAIVTLTDEFGNGAQYEIDSTSAVYETPIGTEIWTRVRDFTSWQKLRLPMTLAASSSIVVSLQGFLLPAGAVVYYDQLALGEQLFTTTIHDAIVSDLGDIDGTGIFSTTLAQVSEEPLRFDEMKHPTALVETGEGADDPETIGNKTREATQTYTIRLGIHSDTPQAGVRALLDDVRNALQRSTSATLTAATSNNKVRDVTCTWTLPNMDQTEHEGIITATIDVTVTYYYDSGGL